MFNSLIKKYFSGLTKNSVLLAFASFFSDVATEMLYPILPIYLTQYMKANGSIVGLIEGIAQATQNIIQGFSGWLSDKLQRRKSIALVGYFLSAVSKPFIGVANTWQVVLAARFSDRLGSGSRSAPRDALIAESVAPEHRGKAFGLEGIGDNLGAFAGPLITVLLFFSLQFDIHYIFYLAIIPGLLAFLMVLLVKEKKDGTAVKSKIDLHISQFPKTYWKYLLVTALFGIGNSSNAFLILEIQEKGLSLMNTVFVYAFYNLVAALISYPAGSLSDKFGRKPLLLISFIIFFISYAGFAFSSDIFIIGFLFIVYGLFQGIYRASGKSYASDFIPKHLRASGIGWYSTVVGLSGLVASIIAGQLWDKLSHASVFIYGAALSFIGIISLLIAVPNNLNKEFKS
ncbi:MAG TPA: MFS transporter [Chitinophagaceae bacterium]|jgi:MFS family permease|nr:MFS transporter [Chitinophagaceae bacterium]